jgi:hypothetical protein
MLIWIFHGIPTDTPGFFLSISISMRSSVAERSVRSARDRGSYATLVSHWMGDHLLSRAPCFGRHVKQLVPAVFALYLQSLAPTNLHYGGL